MSVVILAALAASAPTCTAAVAEPVTVAAIGENLEKFAGRCVRVGGPFASISLYGGIEDMYRIQRFAHDGNYDPGALRRGRVGIYSRDNSIRRLQPPIDGVGHLDIIGTVGSCDALRAAADARQSADQAAGKVSIIMLSGYCHYYQGAVIHAVEYAVHPTRRYDRLVGEANRKRLGNLAPMPRDWPHAAALNSALADLRALLRTRNRARLLAAHEEAESSESEHDREVLDLMLERSDSPFAPARTMARLPAQIFVDRLDIERRAAGRLDPNPAGLLCICRTSNCEGRWPISWSDADNHSRRPYACTRANWRYGKGGKRMFETAPGRAGWLGEPAFAKSAAKPIKK